MKEIHATDRRKLASIQRILSLEAIEGADAIEKARVLGWSVVVKKGEFAVGDLCVYCEIDSLLPERPEFEFLRASRFRIRTVRLRGQISQGICFPLSLLGEAGISLDEGEDVTDVLGVSRYEAPVPVNLSGQVRGAFPSWLKKTDEVRIQSVANVQTPDGPENAVLYRHRGENVYVTEKLDGSSLTVWFRDGEMGVCSRNLDLLETSENTLWSTVRELDIESALRRDGRNLTLQGELIGPGIQKNRYGLSRASIRFFNVFLIDEYRCLDRDLFVETIHDFRLETVPILEDMTLDHSVDELVILSEGPSVLRPAMTREGIVVRPLIEGRDEDLGRFSFKVISPSFLLKGGE